MFMCRLQRKGMVKDMEHKNDPQRAKMRGVFVTGIVTAAALVAMIGVYQGNRLGPEEREPLPQQAEKEVETEEIRVESEEPAPSMEEGLPVMEELSSVTEEKEDSTEESSYTEEAKLEPVESEDVFFEPEQEFGPDSDIAWPVEGDVVMNYSMDKTVYFATLDQYKYNPAILIAADVNTKVRAGAAGSVHLIETTEETGTTVTIDLGNGYMAIYGQLKEVDRQEGDRVRAEDVIGYVAEPTKYYSLEGSNLYFAMTKDEKPINPLEYLQ